MNMIRGIYHDGIVEPIEKPKNNDLAEVIIIFPDSGKSVKRIGGLYKNHEIDFDSIDQELKQLSSSFKHSNSHK
jgi:hypothetical protein